jgi:hypothetical protein
VPSTTDDLNRPLIQAELRRNFQILSSDYPLYGEVAMSIGKQFARNEVRHRAGESLGQLTGEGMERLEAFHARYSGYGKDIKDFNQALRGFQEAFGSEHRLMVLPHHIRLMNRAYTETYCREVLGIEPPPQPFSCFREGNTHEEEPAIVMEFNIPSDYRVP